MFVERKSDGGRVKENIFAKNIVEKNIFVKNIFFKKSPKIFSKKILMLKKFQKEVGSKPPCCPQGLG